MQICKFFLYISQKCSTFAAAKVIMKDAWFRHMTVVLLCTMSLCGYGEDKTFLSQYPMHTSFILNAAISDYKYPALGFTISRQGQLGYYANFMIGLDNMHLKSDFHADNDGRLTDGENAGLIPFYSGKRACNRLSGTVGATCRMGIPLFAYVGGGYGYRTETRELINHKWVETTGSQGHSGIVEAGLIGHIERLTLQAGYTLFIGQQQHLYHEAKIGIGFTFYKK